MANFARILALSSHSVKCRICSVYCSPVLGISKILSGKYDQRKRKLKVCFGLLSDLICTFWLTVILYSLIYNRTKAMGCVVQPFNATFTTKQHNCTYKDIVYFCEMYPTCVSSKLCEFICIYTIVFVFVINHGPILRRLFNLSEKTNSHGIPDTTFSTQIGQNFGAILMPG